MTKVEIVERLQRYDKILTEAVEKEGTDNIVRRLIENDRHLFRHYFGELLKWANR